MATEGTPPQEPAPTPTGPPEPSGESPRGVGRRRGRQTAPNMLPGRARRRTAPERFLVRLIATGGVVGIGVALGAILRSSNVQGWIIGLVIALVSVILSAILWSSRQL
jgi:protein-S-isoprenylcysteine O-methyltransferase Ste14